MPGWTRGQTRAMREASREYAHHHRLLSTLDHATLVSILTKRESIDEAVRIRSPSRDSPDMPTAPASDLHTPTSVPETEASPHTEIWRPSMSREFHGLLQADTFAPVHQPVENVIDAKWMYTWKTDEQGWIVKAKSRLVTRGFNRREGIDVGDTFPPTVSSSCMRLLSAVGCELDLDLCRFDVDQAFVQSHLNEDVFLRLRKGCGKLSGKVVRLNKRLYGCASKIRFRTMHDRSMRFSFD